MSVTWSSGHVALRVGTSHCKSALWLVWCPCLVWFLFKWRYNVFELSCNLTRPLLEGSWEFMSGSSSQYVTTLRSLVTIGIVIMKVCFQFVTWHYMTTCLNGYVRSKALTVRHHFAMFGGHSSSTKCKIICSVTPQNHVIEGSCNFMSRSASFRVTTLPSLVT